MPRPATDRSDSSAVHVVLSPVLRQRAIAASRLEGVSLSEFVRGCIRDGAARVEHLAKMNASRATAPPGKYS